ALHREGIQLRHLGRLNRLSPELREAIVRAIELTRNNTKLTLSVAFDYGGRDEILQAVKRLLTEGVSPDQVDEALLSRYLYTAELPDPDLVIRTGGEMRLSNFLLWQSAYSEYFHTPVLWPDFGEADVRMALQAFQSRQRRFGAISPSNSFV
ncbi:MAG: di-trans,poly-cis-decaprenylcistransferase, partial [Chloroflexi bacterium]|nr:di-trans,poly-cis-decaprenylcistransferase [Chloroflexota bacterium]